MDDFAYSMGNNEDNGYGSNVITGSFDVRGAAEDMQGNGTQDNINYSAPQNPQPGFSYSAPQAPQQNAHSEPQGMNQNQQQNTQQFDLNDSESLMKQIDEFRTRAMEISKIIGQKENKVRELDRQVQVKENESRELESSLAKKREEAENIAQGVNTQVDRIVRRLEEGQDDISEDISH
ncbi:MAG: hypothetical protein IIZ61_08325, partial [Lachnospiraceae bacterium]|nr:hypothetical protein [Lachnospiraceae bacterium]